MSLLYEDKTELLMRCLFDVQNEVGLGKREEAYHRACKLWLDESAVPYRSKPPHHLYLAGQKAHTLYPDFVLWDSITVELKAVPRDLEDGELVQIFDYLKCRKDRLGLLVNMGLDRVHPQRIVYEEPEYELTEAWDYWTGHVTGRAREVGIAVHETLRAIFDAHGTGYSSEVVQALILFELRRRGLPLTVSPVAKAFYRGAEVDEWPLDCVVVDDCMLLTFTALFDNNNFCVDRGLSFLKALGLRWGIAANFGKKAAQFNGLRHGP